MIKAVIDTNIVFAAYRSSNPKSPNREILERWENHEFQWCYSEDILAEYVEKLTFLGVPKEIVLELLEDFARNGEAIQIRYFYHPHLPRDTDDIAFVLCAFNAGSSHLVSEDKHLHEIAHFHEYKTVKALAFLQELRGEGE